MNVYQRTNGHGAIFAAVVTVRGIAVVADTVLRQRCTKAVSATPNTLISLFDAGGRANRARTGFRVYAKLF